MYELPSVLKPCPRPGRWRAVVREVVIPSALVVSVLLLMAFVIADLRY